MLYKQIAFTCYCGMMIAFSNINMNKEIIQTMKILPIDSICPFEWNSHPNKPVEYDIQLHILMGNHDQY